VIADVEAALLPAYGRAPVTFVSGEGCELVDDAGRRYLDFIAGVAVCALGHAHPAITEAVSAQAARLVHASNLFTNPRVRWPSNWFGARDCSVCYFAIRAPSKRGRFQARAKTRVPKWGSAANDNPRV
jgi:hypothetical protein